MIYINEYYIQSIYIRFLVFSLFFHHRQIQNRLSRLVPPISVFRHVYKVID